MTASETYDEDLHVPLAWVRHQGSGDQYGNMDEAGNALGHWSSVHLAKLPLPRRTDPGCHERSVIQDEVELLCKRPVPSAVDTWGPAETGAGVLQKRFWVRASRRGSKVRRPAGMQSLNRCSGCFKVAEARRIMLLCLDGKAPDDHNHGDCVEWFRVGGRFDGVAKA